MNAAGSLLAALLVPLLFVGSGATALSYEVLWERSLRLSFGISTYSIAVVTGAFMAGLSCGYALGRSSWLRRFHPLRVYAAAEALVALYALAFPVLHGAVDAAYVASGGSLTVRIVLAIVLLFVPTTLMGVTLPVVSRWLAASTSIGRSTALLLAANTLGGVLGTLGTGWYFVRVHGASATSEIATIVNLGVALAGLVLSMALPDADAGASEPAAAAAPRPPADRLLTAAAFLAGFQTMALQVLWNRTLICVVENNTTSFALILASVLLGSAIGAVLYVPLGKRLRGVEASLRAFFVVELVFCALAIVSMPLMNELYAVGAKVSTWWPVRDIGDLLFDRWVLAMLAAAPISAAGAFLLPVLVEARAPRGEGGAAVSAVFAADAIGSLAGSLAAGFVMIPSLGLSRSFAAIAGVAALTGLVVWMRIPAERRSTALGFGGAFAAILPMAIIGPLTLTRWYNGHQGVAGDLLYYKESVSATVSVFEVDGRKELLINCIEEVPNHRDAMVFFKLLAHTPLLLHPKPERELVNALGGGITLGAVLTHGIETEAVELVPEVREAIQFFSEENNNAARRAGWKLVGDDGRNYLRLAREPYDVIAADATHPAAGESWPLYTREYYDIVRAHLRKNGIFAQWLPLHNMIDEDFLGVMRTFRSAFPHMLVLFANRYCVLMGSGEPFQLDPKKIDDKLRADEKVAKDLEPYGIRSGEDLLRYLVMDGPMVDKLAADAQIMTDDHAAVEFAELRRLGVAETFPLDLAKLVEGMDVDTLARRTGMDKSLFAARKALYEAQLERQQPTIDATFAALVKLDGAKQSAPRDQDIQVATENLRIALLNQLAAGYAEILQGPDLEHRVEILYYAQQVRPDDPFLNQILGAAFIRLKRWNDAVPYLEKASAAKPDDKNFQANLVFAYEQSGRYNEALGALERLHAMDPSMPGLDDVKQRIEREMVEKGSKR